MALFEAVPERKQASGQLSLFLVWLGITAVAAYLHPDASGHGTHTQLGLPPCPSVLLFNRPCPGCGLTTSFTAFVHGDFGFAFHAHPLGPLMYVALTVWAWLGLYGFLKNKRLDGSGPTFNRAMIAFVVVFFAFGIVRMAVSPRFAASPELRFVSQLPR